MIDVKGERPTEDLPPDPFGRTEQITITARQVDNGRWELDVDHEGISPWAARSLIREAFDWMQCEIIGYEADGADDEEEIDEDDE